jgi:prophage regulatory protein
VFFNFRSIETTMKNQILRFPKVCEATGLSRSTIYMKIADGTFPKPKKLSKRAVGFDSNLIMDWIENPIEKKQGGVTA